MGRMLLHGCGQRQVGPEAPAILLQNSTPRRDAVADIPGFRRFDAEGGGYVVVAACVAYQNERTPDLGPHRLVLVAHHALLTVVLDAVVDRFSLALAVLSTGIDVAVSILEQIERSSVTLSFCSMYVEPTLLQHPYFSRTQPRQVLDRDRFRGCRLAILPRPRFLVAGRRRRRPDGIWLRLRRRRRRGPHQPSCVLDGLLVRRQGPWRIVVAGTRRRPPAGRRRRPRRRAGPPPQRATPPAGRGPGPPPP